MDRVRTAKFDRLGHDVPRFELPRAERMGAVGNPELPIYDYLDEILVSVIDNPVTIVKGDTGSGKSTQVVQVLAAEAGMVPRLLQPRRIAAREVSARILEELQTSLGVADDYVGYHTGEGRTVTPETRIVMETYGLEFVKEMMSKREKCLEDVIMPDEVHEQSRDIEVVLSQIWHSIKEDPVNVRTVIMSATPNTAPYIDYFRRAGVEPNVIEVPGRLYPIEHISEPTSTVAEQIVKYAQSGNGILAFVPGKREIKDTIDEIRRALPQSVLASAKIYPLHSKISRHQQHAACIEMSDLKIVVSTNVAQTSLTIDGINVVIMSGYERRTELNKRGYESLVLRPISQADITQQAGRAGRLRPGIAVLTRLDNEHAYTPLEARPAYSEAEILNCQVSTEVLRHASVGIDFAQRELVSVTDEARPAFDMSIIRAKESLAIIGALDDDYAITTIGRRMNHFPVRPELARVIVEAEQYGDDITRMAAAMAAVVSSGGLPLYDRSASVKWKDVSDENSSDLLRQLDLFIELRGNSKRSLMQIGIDTNNLERAEEIYAKILARVGCADDLVSPNEEQRETLRHCIYAGYVEHIYRRVGKNAFELIMADGLDEEPVRFELSDRSVVDGRRAPYVVGSPYVIERKRRGAIEETPIIEAVTVLTDISKLGALASTLSAWGRDDIVWRGGRPMIRQHQMFAGMVTGQTRERAPKPSEVVRREVINYVLERPGPAQQQLRDIKRAIEALNHRSREALHVLTQTTYLELIEAAAPPDITDPLDIDQNLYRIMHERNISVDSYVPPADVEQIVRATPDFMRVGDHEFSVSYSNGHAKVRHWKEQQIRDIPEDVYLTDGRRVRFVHKKRELTITELREELGIV